MTRGDTAMPRIKTAAADRIVKRYEKALGDSLEREKGWKQHLEVSEAQVVELTELLAAANASTDAALSTGDWLREHNAIFHRQNQHLRGTYLALAQRFVGVKLESQGFNLAQGNQWFANENSTMEQSLERIADQVSLEFHNQAEERRPQTVMGCGSKVPA
jgi:hypothetical protein